MVWWAIQIQIYIKRSKIMNFNNIKKRALLVLPFALVATLLGAQASSAHVSIQTHAEVFSAGGSATLYLRVPHGKAGFLTNKVEVQLPENIGIVKPEHIPGWTEVVTNDVAGKNTLSVSWSGGSLADSSFQDFGLRVTLPATPGVTIYFPTVQTLSDGSTEAWVTIPVAGQPEPAMPAPAFKLVDKAQAVTLASLQAQIVALQAKIANLEASKSSGFMATLDPKTGKTSFMIATSYLNMRLNYTIDKGDVKLHAARFDSWGNAKGTFTNTSLKAGDVVTVTLGGVVVAQGTIK